MSKEMKGAVGTDAGIMDAASDFVTAKATSAAIGEYLEVTYLQHNY